MLICYPELVVTVPVGGTVIIRLKHAELIKKVYPSVNLFHPKCGGRIQQRYCERSSGIFPDPGILTGL